jgi:hypothetical protein
MTTYPFVSQKSILRIVNFGLEQLLFEVFLLFLGNRSYHANEILRSLVQVVLSSR